jgi:hypothetical protein
MKLIHINDHFFQAFMYFKHKEEGVVLIFNDIEDEYQTVEKFSKSIDKLNVIDSICFKVSLIWFKKHNS